MNDIFGSRRLVAFLLDCLIFGAIAIAVFYPVRGDLFRIGSPLPEISQSSFVSTRNGTTTALISGTWTSAECKVVTSVSQALLSPIAPIKADRVLLCADRFLGIASGHTAYVHYRVPGNSKTVVQGNRTATISERGTPAFYTVTVDAEGAPVRAIYPVGLLTFGLMFAVAALGGRTPGKRLASLRVEPVGGSCIWCRELRRLGPLLVAAVFSIVTGLLPLELATAGLLQWGVLGLTLAFWLFAIWYYGVPFFAAHGVTRYDHATGFRVVLG
ncbi:MAG: hypothetical protein HC844_13305 [Tabrizicola sp.]|nr:hypothetical protein [Tabrizicola sp.]